MLKAAQPRDSVIGPLKARFFAYGRFSADFAYLIGFYMLSYGKQIWFIGAIRN